MIVERTSAGIDLIRADHVVMRPITTYAGRGTQWLSDVSDCYWSVLSGTVAASW